MSALYNSPSPRARRVAMFTDMVDMNGLYVGLSCGGRLTGRNPDLRWLVRHKLAKLTRHYQPSPFGNHIRHTKAFITSAGRKWLKKRKGV